VIVSSGSAGFEPPAENEGPKGNSSRQQKEPRARCHGHKRYPLHAEDNERNGSDSASQGIGSKGLDQDHGKDCSSALPLKINKRLSDDSLSTRLIPAVIRDRPHISFAQIGAVVADIDAMPLGDLRRVASVSLGGPKSFTFAALRGRRISSPSRRRCQPLRVTRATGAC
jgi:hypothetical protein